MFPWELSVAFRTLLWEDAIRALCLVGAKNMKLSDWVAECQYISHHTDLFVRGGRSPDFADVAQFLRYCEMQQRSAEREGFPDASLNIRQCMNELEVPGASDEVQS